MGYEQPRRFAVGAEGMPPKTAAGGRPGSGPRWAKTETLARNKWRFILFDDLVSAGEQGRRHVDAQLLRCLEVDHQLEFGRLLDRQVGGLLAI
jgi:hypothetical protein